MCKLKQACEILNLEMPSVGAMSNADKESLLKQAQCNYRRLLKQEHPDVNGSDAAHNRTIELNDAIRCLKAALTKRYVTITEFFAGHSEKKRTKQRSAMRTRARARARPFAWGRPRVVRQYSKSGEFIKTWPSIKKAAAAVDIDRSAISRAVYGYRASAAGYIWRASNVVPSPVKRPLGATKPKPMNQYYANGELKTRWPSLNSAAKSVGVHHMVMLRSAVYGHAVAGYLWKFA